MQIGEGCKQTEISYHMEGFHLALVSQSHVLKAGEGQGQSIKEGEHLWKKMQVLHQTLNMATFWETFKEYFPSVNQKPVLAISREIYIPANWHQLSSTKMLKHRIIFTNVGALNFLSSPKTSPGTSGMPGMDLCWLQTTVWMEEITPHLI